ncbi:MAG: cytochrome P450 [Patulibacter sp.]
MVPPSRPPGLAWHPLRQSIAWLRQPDRLAAHALRCHGDLFVLRVFGSELVMHASPALVQELVTQPPDVLAAGRANEILAPMVGSASLLLLDGDEHLAMRRVQLPPFHGERMRAYERTMQAVAEAGVARWPLEAPAQAWPRMQAITLDIIIRVIFGMQDGRRSDEVRRAVKELLRVGTRRSLFAAAGLRAAATGRRPRPDDLLLRSVARARGRLAALLEAEIRGRRDEQIDRGDVLSLLLAARDADGRPLPTELLRDQLVTLLVAGHETTATALSWAVERIARHPDLQERLAAQALDGRHELIDATVKEVLRVRPVLPLFMRQVVQPVEIGGFRYEPGEMLAGATIALHQRPDLYPDPHAFRPERFLGDHPPGTYGWTPFGGGVRRCLGASFAQLEMRVVLAALLAERRLEPVDRRDEPIRRRSVVLAPGGSALVRAPRRRAAWSQAADCAHSEVG